MNIVKCPNPTCPFQFDASLVPPGAVIGCPQCRLQFQLPASPTAGVAPPPPPADDVEPLIEDEPADDTAPRTPLARRKGRDEKTDAPRDRKNRDRDRTDRDEDAPPPKKAGSMAPLIAVVVVGFVFICGGGVVGLGFLFGWFSGKADGDKPEFQNVDYGLSLNSPGDGWSKDDSIKKTMGVKLGTFSRTGPEGYTAVQVTKMDGEAQKGDLLPQALATLKKAFEDVDENLTPTDAKLLGVAAQKYDFVGRYKPTGTGCRGEVYAVATRDTMVWVYTWAERDKYDDLAGVFDKFRAGVKLDPAKSNDPIKRVETQFRTNSGLYILSESDGQWKKQTDPKRQDPSADLWLSGVRKAGGGKDGAELVVAILEPTGDARKQAQAHILDQFASDPVLTELTGEPDGDPPPGGPVAASNEVVRLKLKYPGFDRSAEKLLVFKVADSGGKRVVVYASCDLKHIGYWEQRLMGIVGSLKTLK